jgi:hypothetical protein
MRPPLNAEDWLIFKCTSGDITSYNILNLFVDVVISLQPYLIKIRIIKFVLLINCVDSN